MLGVLEPHVSKYFCLICLPYKGWTFGEVVTPHRHSFQFKCQAISYLL